MSESNGGTLTVYQRMNDPLEAVNQLGTAIAKSGMFGCGSIDQGKVLALECLARGMPPLTLAERFHVVQGKLMMKYDAMLAEFHALGGKHKIVCRTEDKAEVQLTIDGETHSESLTWEQAQKEKWPFKSDGKSLKDNWATPRARRQMLWARVVSEGVRALRPGVNNGRYVVEEIDSDEPAAAVTTPTPTATTTVAKQQPAAGEVIDGDFEVKSEFTTDDQRQKIESLFDQLGMTADQREKAIQKRKASTLRDMTATAAAELITALNSRLDAVKAQHEASLPPLEPGSAADGKACGPCTPDQDAAIKRAFEEWKQIDRVACDAALLGFKKKLIESGRQKIAELSANDAARLYAAIQVRKLDSFFARSLEQWRPVESVQQSQQQDQPQQQQAA